MDTTIEEHYIRVPAGDLKNTVACALREHGVTAEDAAVTGEVLVEADLRGIESHGVARLVSYYIAGLEKDSINTAPQRKICRDSGAVFVLDADNGLGHPAGHEAMNRCLDLAEETGVAVGAVRNSNHFGIAGYYAMMALERNMIGLCLCNSQPLVFPTYGRAATLGTNPIAVAVPAGEYPDFVLDMATSVVPIGRVEVWDRKDLKVPLTWGADGDGLPTDEPSEILEEGGLLPLGGTAETSGYKGYGLAAVVDVLSGVLSGAAFLTGVSSGGDPEAADVGHFFAALRIDAMMDPEDFLARMDQFIGQLKTSPMAAGASHIYVAGEKEILQYHRNLADGVPLHPKVWAELVTVCQDVNIDVPTPS